MRRPARCWPGLALGLFLLYGFALTGCTDEEVVFRDRPLFEDPPAASGAFLGFTGQEEDEKLTVCGNCHVGLQASWETTGHADAWNTLQASGSAQEFCEGCHSVNELGNTTEEPAGWVATRDPRFQNVQCESCHGPGEMHVSNPDGSQPLASVVAGLDATAGCGECHEGTHHPFTEQWAVSRHGTVPAQPIALAVSPTCLTCHEGTTAMSRKFGETSDFLEKASGDPQPIVCVTCHDPHGSDFEANLRAPIAEASEENLCVTCHSREGTPAQNAANFRGPHGYQGLLVLGMDVGWIPPEFEFDPNSIVSTHGTEANPKLCATCHVAAFEVTDAATGEFVINAVGHTFEAIPCTDAQGVPFVGDCEITERYFGACTEAGCHGSANAARSALITTRQRIEDLLDQLWFDTDGDNVMDATDQGLLPQVVALGDTTRLNPRDNLFTVAEGALWNAQIAHTNRRTFWADGEVFGQGFSTHKGSGEGVHNPFLLEALLRGSIDAVRNEFGFTLRSGISLEPQLTPPPGVSLR